MTLPQVIEWKQRDIPHGMEIEGVIEFTAPDGGKTVVRSFLRKIDLADSYTVFNHVVRNSETPQTFIVSGTKGEVDGDRRSDRLETLHLLPDGTIRRSEPQTVQVRLDNPYAGFSPNEIVQRMANDHPAGG